MSRLRCQLTKVRRGTAAAKGAAGHAQDGREAYEAFTSFNIACRIPVLPRRAAGDLASTHDGLFERLLTRHGSGEFLDFLPASSNLRARHRQFGVWLAGRLSHLIASISSQYDQIK